MPQSIWYQDVNELIAQHHYNKAIEQIKNTSTFDKNKLNQVLRLAKEHHNKNGKIFYALVQLKEWSKAKKILLQLHLFYIRTHNMEEQ